MEDHKATGRKKINCVYKSVNQTYKSAHNSKVKIIDLTEKEQRILTSFHKFFHIEDQNDGIGNGTKHLQCTLAKLLDYVRTMCKY